jgi:hypothetical protein
MPQPPRLGIRAPEGAREATEVPKLLESFSRSLRGAKPLPRNLPNSGGFTPGYPLSSLRLAKARKQRDRVTS